MSDAGAAAAGIPAPSTPRNWVRARWGSWLLGIGGVLGYFGVAQILPGVVVGLWLVVRAGGNLQPDAIVDQIVPYLSALTVWAALVGLALVGVLKLVGCLAPSPAGRGPWFVRIGWVVGASVVCLLGEVAIAWGQEKLGFPMQEQEMILKALAEGGIAFYVAGIVVAPVGEEFVFRRFLFSTVALGNSRAAAYIATAILFALIHLNPPGFLIYAWIAVCCAAAYERTGTIWGAVAVHVINNLVAFCAHFGGR